MEFIYLAILGVMTGTISALFGIGGGMIIVPCMLYFHHIAPHLEFSSHDAVGISVMQMIFSSLFGTFLNLSRKKNIDIKEALFLGIGGSIGASFSGFILMGISSKHLTLIFLLVSCYTFYKFFAHSKVTSHTIALSTQRKNLILVMIGALTGIFAISLGIGGGVLMAPLLAYYLGFDTKKIVPLSLFFIVCASIAGSASFVSSGIITDNVLHAGLILGACSLIGVLFGSKLIERISLKTHRKILIGLYLLSILATFNKVLSYYS